MEGETRESASSERTVGEVLESGNEAALPPWCAVAFEEFESQLAAELESRPPWLDLELDGVRAAYFPNYPVLAPKSLGGVLFLVGMIWFLCLLVTAGLVLVAAFALPESWSRPAAIAVPLVIGALALAWSVRVVARARANNRRIRARGRPIAFGTFCLAQGLVKRYPDWCAYFPRASVVEIFEEAIRTSGGSSTSPRTTGYSCELRFRKAAGQEDTTSVFNDVSTWHHSPRSPRARRLEDWLRDTA